MVVVTAALQAAPRGKLLRILGLSFGIAVGVGAMIGVGILRTPPLIAAQVPVAWIILTLWAIGAIHAVLEANIISELGTALPHAGGPYVYVHRAFGDIGGLAVGWTTWLQRLASTAALSVAFADFLALLWPAEAAFVPLTAVIMQLAMFGLNMIGLREGRTMQQVTSAAKAIALLAFCVAAVVVAPMLWPHATVAAAVPAVGWIGLIAAYQLIVGAYSGWYEPAFFAEENVEPGRSLPRAMGISIGLTAVIYLSVNAALLYALGAHGMGQNALPFTIVLAKAGGPIAAALFAIGAMISVASCSNAGIMTSPRVLYALSRNGLLPPVFQNVNSGGSPYVACGVTALCAIALALSGSFNILFGLIGTLGVASFVLVVASLFVLRRREPGLARPFRAIGYPVLPAIVLVLDGGLLLLFLNADWRGGIFAMVMWMACIPFALLIGRGRKPAV